MKYNKFFTPMGILYIWLFLFCFCPIFLIIIASLLTQHSDQSIGLPLTFLHYKTLLNPIFFNILCRSIIIGGLTTFLCLLIGYPFSYCMIKAKHPGILLLLIIIPFWTSSLIRTYALLALLKTHGLINDFLLYIHVIDKPLHFLYSNGSVLVGLVYTLFPFMVLPIYTQMERFDTRLIEAAKDLGANKCSIFFRVFLPNTLYGVLSGCFLVFLPAITLFYIPNILGGARSIFIGNLIQNQFFISEDWPGGAATSLVLTLLLLLLTFFFRRPNQGGAS